MCGHLIETHFLSHNYANNSNFLVDLEKKKGKIKDKQAIAKHIKFRKNRFLLYVYLLLNLLPSQLMLLFPFYLFRSNRY